GREGNPRTYVLLHTGFALGSGLLAAQCGGHAPRGTPISHSWPNGSTIRPSRQPCSLPTGEDSVAPAATARRTTLSGSSTTSSVRLVAPSIIRGLSRLMVRHVPATPQPSPPTPRSLGGGRWRRRRFRRRGPLR